MIFHFAVSQQIDLLHYVVSVCNHLIQSRLKRLQFLNISSRAYTVRNNSG